MSDEQILGSLGYIFGMHKILKTVPGLLDYATVTREKDAIEVRLTHQGTNLNVVLAFNPARNSFAGLPKVIAHFKLVNVPNPNAN